MSYMSKILQNLVVLSLLLFAVSEVVAAQPCSDELGGITLSNVHSKESSDESTSKDNSLISSKEFKVQSKPVEEGGRQAAECDECFCCCSHILPSNAFDATSSEYNLMLIEPWPSSLPSSPSRDTFHPPRHA